MKRLRLVALTLLGLSLACTASKSAFANILIQIDKPSQTMTVSVNGAPVSHGCVRLSLSNATTLYQLVAAEGIANTKVVVIGPDPPGVFAPSQPPPQRRPFLPFGGLFRF